MPSPTQPTTLRIQRRAPSILALITVFVLLMGSVWGMVKVGTSNQVTRDEIVSRPVYETQQRWLEKRLDDIQRSIDQLRNDLKRK